MKLSVASIPQRDLCCSCGACSGICPQEAIIPVFKQGVFIPLINEDLCTGCGLCIRVCPSTPKDVQTVYGEPELFSEEERECYIAFSNKEEFRREGTSGGVVSTIIYELLRRGIYDKAYVLNFERFDGEQATIKPIDCKEDVIKSAKSKYIPASIARVIKDIRNGIIGRSIVVATPCQTLAIKESFKLKKQSEENVLFIGLFCDKTLNYNIYGYYQYKYGKYDYLHFRDKDGNGWPGDTVLGRTGSKTVIDKQVRISLKPFFQLNRCRYCFDKLNQLADISCGDCYIKGEESKGGKSSIIVRTKKGHEAINESSSLLSLKKSSLRDIKISQGLKDKLENYYRNSLAYSPFCVSRQVDRMPQSEDSHNTIELLHMGENATDSYSYKRIDRRVSMDRMKKGKSKLNKCFTRLLKLFYNPDPSIIILIDNAGFINKGAELMLRSIVQQLEALTTRTKIVVPQKVFFENLDYCNEHSILPLHLIKGRYKRMVLHFIYYNLLNKPWMITPEQIDIVLDAGGFQFSDQWPVTEEGLSEKRRYYSSFTKKNKKIVFLPQAFGPFERPLSRQLIKTVHSAADLIYSREKESYSHLISLFPGSNKIKIAPDFTCLSKDYGLESIVLPKNYVVLIPNVRMVTHTAQEVSDNYLDFIYEISEFLLSEGETLVYLNHEGKDDLKLMLMLNERLSGRVLILSSLDALEVKKVIGEAKLVISSRFHGVVSGLTQCVPTLCTSWSHKYLELLKEYCCESCLLSIDDLIHAKHTIMDALENPSVYTAKDEFVAGIKAKSHEMWDEIWSITGLQKRN